MSVLPGDEKERREIQQLEEPAVARLLFADVRFAWIWLILRVYVGYEWLMAGIDKIGNPAWTGSNAGAAITGFANGALNKTGGAHPDVQTWYASFLRDVVLPYPKAWSYLITIGETAVGIALILGLFTGIAAFFGSLMNSNYLLAGAVSSNPILFIIATWLVLAWRVAGWWGLDRWVLPALGTPWRPGLIFRRDRGHDQDQGPQQEQGPTMQQRHGEA
jgi:thiosulfate dehydrogenase [quinone] large subunit